MNIERALAIKGWMTDHELCWLADQASRSHKIIEVGCAYGRSTRVLADNNLVGFVYAVDTWNGSPDELDTNHKEFRGDNVYQEFCHNLWAPIVVGTVIPFRMDSTNAAGLFRCHNLRADFIFIDADHSFEAVVQDIICFRGLVKQGGIIAGHDYQDSNWPGVTKAVDEIFPDVQVAPLTHIWFAHL